MLNDSDVMWGRLCHVLTMNNFFTQFYGVVHMRETREIVDDESDLVNLERFS